MNRNNTQNEKKAGKKVKSDKSKVKRFDSDEVGEYVDYEEIND